MQKGLSFLHFVFIAHSILVCPGTGGFVVAVTAGFRLKPGQKNLL
jgi:hypothetical protein